MSYLSKSMNLWKIQKTSEFWKNNDFGDHFKIWNVLTTSFHGFVQCYLLSIYTCCSNFSRRFISFDVWSHQQHVRMAGFSKIMNFWKIQKTRNLWKTNDFRRHFRIWKVMTTSFHGCDSMLLSLKLHIQLIFFKMI